MLVGQNSWGRYGGMLVGQPAGVGVLVGQTAGIDKKVCWSVKQLG